MKRMVAQILAAAALLMPLASMGAQSMKSDIWSTSALLERAGKLKERAAAGVGSASETLEKYPHHFTMLAFRARSGGAELHRDYADLFVILDGRATLVTGGAIEGAHGTGEGETRGTAVTGGQSREVSAGDVVHIPAGATVTYFVTKVEEGR